LSEIAVIKHYLPKLSNASGGMKTINVIIRLIVFSFFISIALLSLAAPTMQTFFGFPYGEKIYSFLSPICHQYPTRSLWILERPFALCSRCFAGYLGIALTAVLVFSMQKYIKRLTIGVICLIPGIFDGLLQLFTEYESSNLARFLTGILGGFGIFMMIFPLQYNRRAKNANY